ncbi:Protein CutA, chloroplastic [Dictyocoela muelleri]|nr:Protein CutA, chloroplastic [Dictyocoela muelleri]
MKVVSIHVTTKTKECAEKIMKDLIERKYASCIHMIPIKSSYLWENKMVMDSEIVLNIATTDKYIKNIEDFVKNNGEYEIPHFMVFKPIYTSASYDKWINDSLNDK